MKPPPKERWRRGRLSDRPEGGSPAPRFLIILIGAALMAVWFFVIR